MNNNPLVSVCIAVYNRENFIKAAIESVFAQTYQNFEIIVIDDGSTDNTVSVINSIKDSRIKLFKNDKNRGVVYTRNRYLKIATGDYLAILDSDDIWLPSKLKQQISFFNKHSEYGICGTNAIRKYSNGKEDLWKYPSSDAGIRVRLFWGSAMIHSSMIINNSIIKDNDIHYADSLNPSEDFDFIRQVVSKTKAYNIDEELVIYNLHDEQLTVLENSDQIDSAIKIVKLYFDNLGIKMNSETMKAYKKVFIFKFNLNIEELLCLKELFEEIKKTNHIHKFTSNLELFNNLKKQWFLACYNSTLNGFTALTIFNSISKELKMKISFNKKLKFYFKCIMG